MNSGPHPDTARFLNQLMRFRRRLAVVSFVSHLPTAAAVSLVATGGTALAAHPIANQQPLWLAAGVALTLAVAGIIARARTPSLARAAATLDRRFRLDDRAVTALDFARDSGAVSQLIVTDASAHLAAHAPQELSLQFPRRFGWLSAGVVAVFLAVVVGRSPLSPDAHTPGQDPAAKTGKGASGVTRPAPSPAPTDSEAKAEGAAASRGSVNEPSARAGQKESSLTAQTRANPTLDRSAAQAKSSQGESPSRAVAAEARGGDRANTPGPSGALTSGSVPRSGTGDARNNRGAGLGGGPVAGADAGTGGASGAARSTALPPPPTRQPDADSSYAARFRRAWTHEESPAAQERIPAGRRAYVRDYFLAIRPDGRP
jgi:hypothetical protein